MREENDKYEKPGSPVSSMPFTFPYCKISTSVGMSIHIPPNFLKRKSMIKEPLLGKVKKNQTVAKIAQGQMNLSC